MLSAVSIPVPLERSTGPFLFRFSELFLFVTIIKADPRWAPFTALRYKELGLLISAREVGLPISLRLTDSIKIEDKLLLLRC